MTDTERPAGDERVEIPRLIPGSALTNYPPPERWDDWEEYDAKAWPQRKPNRF